MSESTGLESEAAAASVGEESGAVATEGLSLERTFAALRHRNYRLWFIGQMVSLFGTWMQVTAQGFLVFELTESPAYLGYVGFAGGVPAWLFTLYGGVIADRVPRRWLLSATQAGMMALAIFLAADTFLGLVTPWHIVVLAFLLGIINAFDAPARQAFVLELVDKEEMTNAIALNSSVFNLATTFGPAIAGVTYAVVGPAWCFAINALSFVAVIAALALMRLPALMTPRPHTPVFEEVGVGLRFVAGHPVIRLLIASLAVISVFGFSMMTLMPAWSVSVLDGGPRTNGLLLSARGLGSLAGALMVASVGTLFYRGRMLALAALLLPVLMFVFATIHWLPLALVALVAAGWAFMVVFNMLNSLVQLHTPDYLRGRVMSVYTLTFFGLMPLGALLVGTMAARLGAPLTVMINASLVLVLALGLWFGFPAVRNLR
ncbi:MAG: MFS transporter [Deltaproteobacteria bacterium]|nr:MFS transporter [Deltaproteobacteria bacterium]